MYREQTAPVLDYDSKTNGQSRRSAPSMKSLRGVLET